MLKRWEGEKRRQVLLIGLSLLLLGAGLYVFDRMSTKPPSPPPQIGLGEEDEEEDLYKELYLRRVSELESRLEEIKKEIQSLKREREKQAPPPLHLPPPPPPKAEPPKAPPPVITPPPPPPPPKKPQDLIGVVKQKVEKKKEKKEEKKPRTVIPAGSFVRAVLLSGLDAPAGGKAISNPHPVLLRITDEAVLPNLFKADVKECFLLGSGYGDLSSERAYIRLEVLSCVKEDGTAVQKKVKGFVAGEDGKEGLRGRVVTRQGQLLARALIAGFLEGVARAFSTANTNVIVSPQGALTTVKPDQALAVGLAGGFSEAAKKLADFYVKLASQMFPVIEIQAGRKVDVVFLESVVFDD